MAAVRALVAISIHAPLAGCDALASFASSRCARFQSTHPLRGATPDSRVLNLIYRISIHAPLAGCDPMPKHPAVNSHNFNPRTPCGVRLPAQGRRVPAAAISIHAPLAGCDCAICSFLTQASYFNPRTPCGVRPSMADGQKKPQRFQSTHPLRGATAPSRRSRSQRPISIHAPLAGCDAVP